MDKTASVATTTRSCSRCEFCGSTPAGDKTLQLVCRKKPPLVSAALMVSREGQPQWTGVTNWPNVTAADWCGDFAPQFH